MTTAPRHLSAGLSALLGSSLRGQTLPRCEWKRPGWLPLHDGLDDVTWMCQREESRPSRGPWLQTIPITILCHPGCQGRSLLETSRTLEDIKSSSFSEGVQGAPRGAQSTFPQPGHTPQ